MSRFSPAAETWRLHPFITKTHNIRGMFPGMGIAAGAFAVYCVFDFVGSSMSKKSAHDSHSPAAAAHNADSAHASHAAPANAHGASHH